MDGSPCVVHVGVELYLFVSLIHRMAPSAARTHFGARRLHMPADAGRRTQSGFRDGALFQGGRRSCVAACGGPLVPGSPRWGTCRSMRRSSAQPAADVKEILRSRSKRLYSRTCTRTRNNI